MSLPSQVLQPATRALGMGLFFTIYYVPMMVGPIIAGSAAKWTGSAAAAFDFGALVLVVVRCCCGRSTGFPHQPPTPASRERARSPQLPVTPR